MKLSHQIKRGITLGIITLSLQSPAQAFTVPFKSAQEYATSASQLMQMGRYEEALTEFRKASYLVNDVNNKRYLGLIFSDMGECSRRLKRPSEAKAFFSKAYPLLRSQTPRALNVLLGRWAMTFLDERDFAEAAILLEKQVESALGTWTYNYTDLANAPTYIEALVSVVEANGGDGQRIYAGAMQGLANIARAGGADRQQALITLNRVERNKNVRYGIAYQQYSAPINTSAPSPTRRDPYFSPTPRVWRNTYGLNGTERLFQNGGR
jgi:tetratricopeptide (TPR) repeat protein